jgi:hypothetical protein
MFIYFFGRFEFYQNDCRFVLLSLKGQYLFTTEIFLLYSVLQYNRCTTKRFLLDSCKVVLLLCRAIWKSTSDVKCFYLPNCMLHCYNSCSILRPIRYHLASHFNVCTDFCKLKDTGSISFLKMSRGTVAKLYRIYCSKLWGVLILVSWLSVWPSHTGRSHAD